MATLKIDHRLIARIRTNLPSARVRADLKPITERVINPVLSGAITVPADVKTEIESLQAQLLQIVPTLPKGAPIAPIDIDALVTPVPAPLPQPLPQPLPAPLPVPVPALAPAVSPAQSTDPNAGRMSVFTQQAAMQAIQGAAAAAAANPAPAPVPAPNPARQLGAAQAEVERLSNQLVRLEQESADIIQAKQNELVKEQEHAHRLETSLGGARDKAREMEAERDKAKARVTALEKELVALRTSQQAVSDINDQLLAAQGELNTLKARYKTLETEKNRLNADLIELRDSAALTQQEQARRIQAAEKQLQKLTEEKTGLQEELALINASASDARFALEAERITLTELKNTNKAQGATIADLTKQIETLQQELAKKAEPVVSSPILTGTPLEMIRQAIALALDTLASQAEAINGSISEINAAISAKEGEAADLELQVTARRAQMSQANQRYQSKIDNLDSEYSAAADNDEGIKIARQTIARLTTELETAIDPTKREQINSKLLSANKFLAQLETGLRRELRLGSREQISAEMQRDLTRRNREIDSLIAKKTNAVRELDRSLAAREQARLKITPLVDQLNQIRGIINTGESRVSSLLDSLPLIVDSTGNPPNDNQANS